MTERLSAENSKTSLFNISGDKSRISPSLEDYLETMLFIMRKEMAIRVTDVADSLNISKPSVNKAVRMLSELGLVNHEKYGRLHLTESGMILAKNVASRHHTITRFLSEFLGIDESIAEEEACKMEHSMSFETAELLEAFMEKERKRDGNGRDKGENKNENKSESIG